MVMVQFLFVDMFICVNMSSMVYNCCFLTKCMSENILEGLSSNGKKYNFFISGLFFCLKCLNSFVFSFFCVMLVTIKGALFIG